MRCQMRLMKYCVNNDRDVCSDDVPRHLPGHVWPQVGSAMMQKLADHGHWRRLPKRSRVDVLHPRAFHRDCRARVDPCCTPGRRDDFQGGVIHSFGNSGYKRVCFGASQRDLVRSCDGRVVKAKAERGSQSASDLAAAKTNEAHAKELFRHLAWIFAVRERVDDGNDQAMSDVALSLSRRYNSTRLELHPQARRHWLERRGGSQCPELQQVPTYPSSSSTHTGLGHGACYDQSYRAVCSQVGTLFLASFLQH